MPDVPVIIVCSVTCLPSWIFAFSSFVVKSKESSGTETESRNAIKSLATVLLLPFT